MPHSSVEQIQLDELLCWRVRYGSNTLLISQQGAQVLSYIEGERPLIWLSDLASFKRGQPVRGGIPICWPWFANLGQNPPSVQAMHLQPDSAPAHGFVRGVDWQLQGIQTSDDGIHLDFTFDIRLNPQPDWPHDALLQLHLHLDERLHIALTTCNRGDTNLTYSQALHSYFAVSDIRNVQIDGLQGSPYLDCLDGWKRQVQDGLQHFSGETDRVYLETADQLTIIDEAWQRRIHLHSSGSRSAVVWNPWISKSLRLSQFAHHAWQNMLCIEHANAADDCKTLSPGERHILKACIWSE